MRRFRKAGDADSGPPKPPVLPPPAPEPEMGREMGEEDLDDLDIPESQEPPEGMPEEAEEPAMQSTTRLAPPLFIKIDKYEDVIKNVQELRSYALSLRDALDALADIEKELKVGMEIAHRALDRANAIISVLDSKLVRTDGIDIEGEIKAPKEIEGYIKNVYGQIERLKDELRAIE